MNRINEHPIIGNAEERTPVTIYLDGTPYPAYEGDMIAAALLACGREDFVGGTLEKYGAAENSVEVDASSFQHIVEEEAKRIREKAGKAV